MFRFYVYFQKFLLIAASSFFLLGAQSLFANEALANKTSTPEAAEKKNTAKKENPVVQFRTTSGTMVIELYPDQAPLTVANFLKYVDDGFYNGTIFHRVVPGFVVQGGGLTFDFQHKPTRAPIKNESDNGLKNLQATLSMARTSNPNSATSQFFINTVANPSLDYRNGQPGYAVFGKVIKGFDVVKKIEAEPRGLHRTQPEAPNYAVVVEKAERKNKK